MKILLTTESIAGTGHHKAAENVAKGIRMIYPEAAIQTDTCLSKVSPLLEKLTSSLYMGTIRYSSGLWGWAYQRDKQWSKLGKEMVRDFTASRLQSYVEAHAPDLIISTHAFCLGGLAKLKERMEKPFRLGAALTDFCVNPFWIHQEIDLYFVGAMHLKQRMMEEYQVSGEKIHVTGIPIDPRFSQPLNQQQVKAQLSLPAGYFHLLVLGGGLGLVPYTEILSALQHVKGNLAISVVTGRNNKALRQIERWLKGKTYPHPIQLLEYVGNMNEWMSAADMIIGKPGGLTVSEALACGIPFLIFKPIPGQEERNSQFLLEHGLALRADHAQEISHWIRAFYADRHQLEQMKGRIREFSKPEAAYEMGKILMAENGIN